MAEIACGFFLRRVSVNFRKGGLRGIEEVLREMLSGLPVPSILEDVKPIPGIARLLRGVYHFRKVTMGCEQICTLCFFVVQVHVGGKYFIRSKATVCHTPRIFSTTFFFSSNSHASCLFSILRGWLPRWWSGSDVQRRRRRRRSAVPPLRKSALCQPNFSWFF